VIASAAAAEKTTAAFFMACSPLCDVLANNGSRMFAFRNWFPEDRPDVRDLVC
jgi:hypothetical protein